MTSEDQQERAALYALGLFDVDEAAAFEREMAADGALRTLTVELREAVAETARAEANAVPPPELKARVLSIITEEPRAGHPAVGRVIAGPLAWTRRVPWAVAAVLALTCGILGWRYLALDLEVQMARYAASFPSAGALQQVSYCPLEQVPAAQQSGPRAAVLWDAARRRGRLRINNLPPAGEGKDYQLWTVESGRKDTVSAGVVKVGPDHSAEVEFQPEGDDGKAEVVAFALSVERAGGVPKNEGPVLYLGKL